MTFDPHRYHTAHSTLNNHTSSQNALNSTMWQHSSTGLELVDENSELPAKLIIVGRVSAFRLKCGPGGNHFANGMSPLEKAKYQFHISQPADRELAADYQAGISTLEKLQDRVATTNRRINMIVDDATGKMIRFVKNVFTLRENAVPDSPHGQALPNTPEMDHETAHWPIPDEFALAFDAIKYKFQVTPLSVFYEGNLVSPIHTNTALNGAIAEIEFTVRHWKIQDHDSFQATAENITILRLGAVHHNINYKRPHVNDNEGPENKKVHRSDDESGSKA